MRRRPLEFPPPVRGVAHISKGKRDSYRPRIVPALPVPAVDSPNPENDRLVLADAEIRIWMRVRKDLDRATLRRIRYVLEKLRGFSNPLVIRKGLLFMMDDVLEIGKPEGLGVLRIADNLFDAELGSDQELRYKMIFSAEQLGTEKKLMVILSAFVSDPSESSRFNALKDFAWWFPDAVDHMVSHLEIALLPREISRNAIKELRSMEEPEITVVEISG